MLRISKLADYGTMVMVYLAQHPTLLLNASVIAGKIHLSVPTVSKLLKLLAQANLVLSQRGTKGGYQLSRQASAISVAQIITAVEGHQGLTECSHHAGDCSLEHVCAIRDNWQVISRVITNALDSVTLEQLAKPHLRQHEVNVTQIRYLGARA